MSLIGRALTFAIKEVVSAAAHEIGQHIGDATGTLLGRRIDSEHAQHDKEEDKVEDVDKVQDAEIVDDNRNREDYRPIKR